MQTLNLLNKTENIPPALTSRTALSVARPCIQGIIIKMEKKMVDFSMSSARRVARQIVDLKDDKRKAVLRTFPTDIKCKIVEEMVNIRLERLRGPDGAISPAKVSER